MSRIVLPPRWQVPPVGAQLDTSHPLYTALVACWPLNEAVGKVANNLAGANSYVKLNTVPLWVGTPNWQASPRGTAAQFDGSTQYIELGQKILFQTTDSFSMACWFRTAIVVGSSVTYSLLDSAFGFAGGGWALLLSTSPTNWAVSMGIRDASAHVTTTNKSSASNFFADSKWHLLAGVRDTATANLRIYLDGLIVGTSGADTTTGVLGNSSSPNIGARGNDHAQKFPGQIGLTAIWNRALSVGEIGQLYAAPYDLFAGNRLVYVIPFTAIARSATDSASEADTLASAPATSATDTASALESLAVASSLSLADTAAVIEALARTLAMSPAEVLSLGDALTLTPALAGSVTDALAGVDSTAPELAQNHTSRLNPNDVLVQAGGAVIVDSVSVADTFLVFVPLTPFGAYRVLTVNITRTQIAMGDAMYTVAGNPALTDIRQGDSYSFNLSGTLGIPGTIATARIMFKTNKGDADADALIDVTLTTTVTSNGQIVTNGAAGPYSVNVDLLPAQTRALVNAASASRPWSGWYELRLTNVGATHEYTPLNAQQAKAWPRLINAV